MGMPRTSRRKVVTISSDEDVDETTSLARISAEEDDENEESVNKPTTSANEAVRGKLKSIKNARKAQQPSPATSTQEASSQQPSPKKPKAKSKAAVKDEPKAHAKTIYSFFNAATQRQQSSQPPPAASQSKPPTPHEDAETIESDHDRYGDLPVSKASSTALALRKRKARQSQSLHGEAEASLPPPATQKFRKTGDGRRTPSAPAPSVVNEDKRPWVEQFAPTTLADLAVHRRKVADVRQWFEAAYAGKRQRVLVLKGAAGTGKTTTMGLLAREMGVEVMEWRNPAGSEYAAEGSVSAAGQFEEFVGRAGRAGGLTMVADGEVREGMQDQPMREYGGRGAAGRQMLLVEEFPNTFSKTSPVLQSFRSALSQYLASPPLASHSPTPIVLVVSETLLSTSTAAADSFTVHRLLGPELLNHPYIDTIEFNAVAPTILTKALESIVINEARKSGRRTTPGPLVLKHLAETGDIRSAVASLEFLCLRGDGDNNWSSKVAFTKPKKSKTEPGLTKAEEEALKLISNRESSLGIFHSVGKVVYNKRTEPPRGTELAQPPPWLPQHCRVKVPETDTDRLIDELGTDTSTFVAALHENYALSCSDQGPEESLDSLAGCIDSLSDADLLSFDRFSYGTRAFSGSATDSLRQDEMAFQAAVRGLLFNLPCPVHRGTPASGRKADAHRIFYPASLRLWRRREEMEGSLDLLTAKAQSGELDGLSSYAVRPVSGDVGVAGWRQDAAAGDSGGGIGAASTSARNEMLLERLPYMARIMTSSRRTTPSFLDRINSVVRVQDSAPQPTDEDDGDDDGVVGQDANQPTEQWATDRPNNEPADRPMRGVKKKTAAGRGQTEGGGLSIPVESSVAKLVLEDDDIVDD